jgi:hypothetical protein
MLRRDNSHPAAAGGMECAPDPIAGHSGPSAGGKSSYLNQKTRATSPRAARETYTSYRNAACPRFSLRWNWSERSIHIETDVVSDFRDPERYRRIARFLQRGAHPVQSAINQRIIGRETDLFRVWMVADAVQGPAPLSVPETLERLTRIHLLQVLRIGQERLIVISIRRTARVQPAENDRGIRASIRFRGAAAAECRGRNGTVW